EHAKPRGDNVRPGLCAEIALRQLARPGFFQRVELLGDFSAKTWAYVVAPGLGVLVQRTPALDRQGICALQLEVRTRDMQLRQRFANRGAVTGIWPPDP